MEILREQDEIANGTLTECYTIRNNFKEYYLTLDFIGAENEEGEIIKDSAMLCELTLYATEEENAGYYTAFFNQLNEEGEETEIIEGYTENGKADNTFIIWDYCGLYKTMELYKRILKAIENE